MADNKKRVLIAKIGLDGHDRGAKVVARALRDAGIEVIYTGIRQTVEDIIAMIVGNDVNVLGLSFLAGDHMTMVPKIKEELQKTQTPDIPLIVGGIILHQQIPELLAMGVEKVFLSGTPMEEIVAFIEKL